jgi:hypothetical protein
MCTLENLYAGARAWSPTCMTRRLESFHRPGRSFKDWFAHRRSRRLQPEGTRLHTRGLADRMQPAAKLAFALRTSEIQPAIANPFDSERIGAMHRS